MPWCGRLWRKPICAAKTRLWPMKPPAGQRGWRPRIRRCSTLSPCTIRKPKISPRLRKRSGNTRPAKARILGPPPAPPTCRYAPATPSRPDDADREFRAAVERDPQLEADAFGLGQMQLRRGDFAGATATLGKACQRFPDSAQMQLAHGVAAYGQRRCADAIDAFLRVTAIDRAVEQPYGFLARILGQADDRLPQVVAAFAAWEKAEPGNYLAVRLHAKALSAASADATEIEEKLRRSIQLSDGYWESHFELGVLLGKKREPKGCRFESYLGRQLQWRNLILRTPLAASSTWR